MRGYILFKKYQRMSLVVLAGCFGSQNIKGCRVLCRNCTTLWHCNIHARCVVSHDMRYYTASMYITVRKHAKSVFITPTTKKKTLPYHFGTSSGCPHCENGRLVIAYATAYLKAVGINLVGLSTLKYLQCEVAGIHWFVPTMRYTSTDILNRWNMQRNK